LPYFSTRRIISSRLDVLGSFSSCKNIQIRDLEELKRLIERDFELTLKDGLEIMVLSFILFLTKHEILLRLSPPLLASPLVPFLVLGLEREKEGEW